MTLEAALDLGIRHLDTAFNYLGFGSHSALANAAGDMLDAFFVSTKVGFFPDGHSLDPRRLRQAIEQSAVDLGRESDLVFLHNPERSLDGLAEDDGRETLAAAIEGLVRAKAEGVTRGWGISSWRAATLARYVAEEHPVPDLLMTKCGLTVSGPELNAAEWLAALLRVPPGSRWGMAPFAGHTESVPWPAARTFRPGRPCSPLQAAFAAAYHLPEVAAVAVGADQPAHLAELVTAARLDIDRNRVAAYRTLVTERKATVTR